MTKHIVTDSRGKAHKRTSSRRYAFAVVHHVPARPAEGSTLSWAAYSKAEWASTEQVANNVADRWRREGRGIEVEIIPAMVLS